jgi:hypothetical protein
MTMDGFTTAYVASFGGLAGFLCLGLAAMFRRRDDRSDAIASASIKRTRLVATFTARDGQGRVFTLSCYQQYFDAGTRDDATAERKGATHILTADGRRVEKLGTRKYRILGSRDVLTSDDVSAP